MHSLFQKTINNKISCNSVSLHSGKNTSLTIIPSDVDTGIIFRRTDLEKGKNEIRADYKNVTTTNLGTTIQNEFGVKISTIEHLMAAIWGCGIDNLIIEIDNIEVPIMDGSSEPFVFLIECAGVNIQNKSRQFLELTKKVRYEENDKYIEASPAKEFSLDLHIDFNHPQINHLDFNYHQNSSSFKNDISRARTFCFKEEIEYMHQNGLAKGGSLANAIVIDQNKIINSEPLRYKDEFIRHKALDFIGDLFLCGKYITANFKCNKTGHTINNKFLHKLFSDQSFWRLV